MTKPKMRTQKEIEEMMGRIEQAQFNEIYYNSPDDFGRKIIHKRIFKKGITEKYVDGLLHGLRFAYDDTIQILIFHEKYKRD